MLRKTWRTVAITSFEGYGNDAMNIISLSFVHCFLSFDVAIRYTIIMPSAYCLWGHEVPYKEKSTRGQLFVLFPQKRRVTALVGNPGARAQCQRNLYSIEVPTFLRTLKSWLSLFPLRYRWTSVAYNEPCKGCYHNLCWISRAYKDVSDVWACSSCYYIGV